MVRIIVAVFLLVAAAIFLVAGSQFLIVAPDYAEQTESLIAALGLLSYLLGFMLGVLALMVGFRKR